MTVKCFIASLMLNTLCCTNRATLWCETRHSPFIEWMFYRALAVYGNKRSTTSSSTTVSVTSSTHLTLM